MADVHTYRAIDDLLGPASSRFFGSGYSRVVQQVRHVETVPTDATSVERTDLASVVYPTDWSTKKTGQTLRPHVSTIDACVFSKIIAESHLRGWAGLTEEQIASSWLRSIGMRAGPVAQEDTDEVKVRTIVVHKQGGAENGSSSFEFTSMIGSMRTEYTVDVPELPGRSRDAVGAELLTDSAHLAATIDLQDIELDLAERTGAATFLLHPRGAGDQQRTGLASAYQPYLTDVHNILGIAQIAQALLYQVDGIERADSNTLWTRSFTARRAGSPRQGTSTGAVSVAMVDHEHLTTAADTWSISSWTSECEDVVTTFELAHKLPVAPDSAETAESRTARK
ncbi:AvrD family protein [Streptomyces sp. NPDC001793]|uniref:AvrD family protein n=1 Tax=Streptomyces sp. NPDC001793 TaxID=3154657 RepID=UPI003321F0E5